MFPSNECSTNCAATWSLRDRHVQRLQEPLFLFPLFLPSTFVYTININRRREIESFKKTCMLWTPLANKYSRTRPRKWRGNDKSEGEGSDLEGVIKNGKKEAKWYGGLLASEPRPEPCHPTTFRSRRGILLGQTRSRPRYDSLALCNLPRWFGFGLWGDINMGLHKPRESLGQTCIFSTSPSYVCVFVYQSIFILYKVLSNTIFP